MRSGWACASGPSGSRSPNGTSATTSTTSSPRASRTHPTSPSPTTCEPRADDGIQQMTDVAVVGFAQAPNVRRSPATTNGVEMLVPIFQEIFDATGLTKADIGFWCSGSSDYLAGRAFSFV